MLSAVVGFTGSAFVLNRILPASVCLMVYMTLILIILHLNDFTDLNKPEHISWKLRGLMKLVVDVLKNTASLL